MGLSGWLVARLRVPTRLALRLLASPLFIKLIRVVIIVLIIVFVFVVLSIVFIIVSGGEQIALGCLAHWLLLLAERLSSLFIIVVFVTVRVPAIDLILCRRLGHLHLGSFHLVLAREVHHGFRRLLNLAVANLRVG